MNKVTEYHFGDLGGHDHHHPAILAAITKLLDTYFPAELERSVCDLGCGYGKITNLFATKGWRAVGLDPSHSGIARGKDQFPGLDLHLITGDDNLSASFGMFSLVISIEVVEHVYSPAAFIRQAADLVSPGGLLILSTPYHGYLKNLLLAITGQLDAHFSALWEGGHIKFWSIASIRKLVESAGLEFLHVYRVGRIPPVARSMVLACKKPLGRVAPSMCNR